MEDYALYEALQSYEPQVKDGFNLEFQKGDIFQISVQTPFGQSRTPALLYAFNTRTRQSGYIPVECVKLLGSEVNKTIHHPSACGVSDSVDQLPKHHLDDVYFVTPILCKHCKDYIWGQGHVGVKCKGRTKYTRCLKIIQPKLNSAITATKFFNYVCKVKCHVCDLEPLEE